MKSMSFYCRLSASLLVAMLLLFEGSVFGQEEILFPGTELFIVVPEHFQLQTNEDGVPVLYNAGAETVVVVETGDDSGWPDLKKSYDQTYFSNRNLVLMMQQDQELPDGTAAAIFICNETMKDQNGGAPVSFRVMIFAGGSDSRTFIVTARIPENLADQMTNVVMNMFYSVHFQ